MKNKLFMFLCGMLVRFIFACSDDEQGQLENIKSLDPLLYS